MVDVAVSDPVSSQEEENLSDTERFELDDFTFISSELAQEVGDGPAEKVDDEDALPDLPIKDNDRKKKKKKKQKKVSEPEDVVPHDADSPSEASVEEKPEKQKKSTRKRLKRTRSDSEEEYDAEEIETPKKRKDRSIYDEDDEDDKLERRKRKGDKDKKREELDNLASIRKAKEKSKTNEKSRETQKSKDKDKSKSKNKEAEQDEEGTSGSDSEPEDTEVVPVGTFLSEFRPSGALLVDEPPSTKRRSKFGESILSKRPSSPLIVPFERPRIKPPVLPAPPAKLPQLSQLPTEPNGYQTNLHQPLPLPLAQHQIPQQLQQLQQIQLQQQLQLQQASQWDYSQDLTDATGFPHHQWDKLMEQQQLELQQQQQLLQQQQMQQQHIHGQPLPPNGERSTSRTEAEHKSHKHKKHDKDKEKRDKEKREKAKREKEKRDKHKREKAKREKKHKEKPPKLDPTTAEYATKRKEFKLKLSETIGVRLKKYFRAKRIATKEDFKHLARKFTHKIMDLEDAKAVFVIKSNTEEKIHKVIDAYFERHNTYSRAGNPSQPADQPDPAVADV